MKVLITGANGFVGKNLVSDFADRGYFVTACSREQLTDMPKGVKWVAAPSLCSSADFGAAVHSCDIVVHAAARVHVMKDNAYEPLAEFRAANVDGTIALARAAVAAGVRHFVFISSVKVNGEETQNGHRFAVTDPQNPHDAYAISKADAETALFAIGSDSGMKITIIRPVLVYGAGVKGNFRTLMAAIVRGVPLPLGGINNARSLVYVRNLTDLIVRVAGQPRAYGKILFASDGLDLSTSELLRMLANGLNCPVRLLPIPNLLQSLAVLFAAENSMVRRLLGSLQVDVKTTCDTLDWAPPYSVSQGIAETAADYLRSLER